MKLSVKERRFLNKDVLDIIKWPNHYGYNNWKHKKPEWQKLMNNKIINWDDSKKQWFIDLNILATYGFNPNPLKKSAKSQNNNIQNNNIIIHPGDYVYLSEKMNPVMIMNNAGSVILVNDPLDKGTPAGGLA